MFRVALIKIDVEGMEMAVLRGAERLVNDSSPSLLVEVTPKSAPEFRGWLDRHKYRVERTFSMYPNITTVVAAPASLCPG
jgi:hypothetical protein